MFVINKNSKTRLFHLANTIYIKFKESPKGLNELLKYNGEMKILSAKINNKNIPIETEGIDYWEMIDSNWESAGKPSQYYGGYFVGKIPKRRTISLTRKVTSRGRTQSGSRGGY